MSKNRKVAFYYAVGLTLVIVLAFIPGLTDDQGKILGLYRNVLPNHLLHAASTIWAFWASKTSNQAAKRFLQIFGTLYVLDGLSGLVTGYNFLNFHFLTGEPQIGVVTRILANGPHLLIGGFAIAFGFRKKSV